MHSFCLVCCFLCLQEIKQIHYFIRWRRIAGLLCSGGTEPHRPPCHALVAWNLPGPAMFHIAPQVLVPARLPPRRCSAPQAREVPHVTLRFFCARQGANFAILIPRSLFLQLRWQHGTKFKKISTSQLWNVIVVVWVTGYKFFIGVTGRTGRAGNRKISIKFGKFKWKKIIFSGQ